MTKTYLVTGGAGFIGSALVGYLLKTTDAQVITLDKLTYAGNLASLEAVQADPRHTFIQGDICDSEALSNVFRLEPDAVFHLAAETHVDRSIDGPAHFVQTNIVGTYTLLESCLSYWRTLSEPKRKAFRFVHVSTDEVYGTLGKEGLFSEVTPYDPRSPYSASKAASDHLARAWFETYGLPVLVTNCSNNYGPYQFPEKLIPVVIQKALAGEPIPIYGSGESVRDWLYVDDHVRGLLRVLEAGVVGETYNIGGHNEVKTLEIAKLICTILDELRPNPQPYEDLISFVADRPGHDMRYAIDASKMKNELDWLPEETFETGIRKTVAWYLNNQAWCKAVMDGSYRLERLGTVS